MGTVSSERSTTILSHVILCCQLDGLKTDSLLRTGTIKIKNKNTICKFASLRCARRSGTPVSLQCGSDLAPGSDSHSQQNPIAC